MTRLTRNMILASLLAAGFCIAGMTGLGTITRESMFSVLWWLQIAGWMTIPSIAAGYLVVRIAGNRTNGALAIAACLIITFAIGATLPGAIKLRHLVAPESGIWETLQILFGPVLASFGISFLFCWATASVTRGLLAAAISGDKVKLSPIYSELTLVPCVAGYIWLVFFEQHDTMWRTLLLLAAMAICGIIAGIASIGPAIVALRRRNRKLLHNPMRGMIGVPTTYFLFMLVVSMGWVVGLDGSTVKLAVSKPFYMTQIGALPARDGYKMKTWDWGRADALVLNSWVLTLVYDESDQIGLPASGRTPEWKQHCDPRIADVCEVSDALPKLSKHFYMFRQEG